MGKQFMGGIASEVVKRTDHSHHVAQVVDAEPAVVGITGLADYTKKYEIKGGLYHARKNSADRNRRGLWAYIY